MLKLMKRFRSREWAIIAICVALVVAQVWLDLRLPEYMSEITALVQTQGGAMAGVFRTGGRMLLCAQVQMVIAMGLQVVVKAPIMAAMAIGKIRIHGNVEWSLMTACAIGLILLVILFLMMYAMLKFKRIQGLTDNLNRVIRENLSGLRVVRADNAEQFQQDKFEEANGDLTETQLKAQRAMVVFSSYAMQVIMSFMMLVMVFVMLPRFNVSAVRINEVLQMPIAIRDGDFDGQTGARRGGAEFRHVSFRYPDAEDYVLRDISFTARQGETVAFIGATDSGKSTVVNLAARFYDATEGQVLIDGVDVKQYRQSALHDKLGYVSQKAVLFLSTVEQNVALGDNGRAAPMRAQVAKAIQIAQGTDFVEALPDAYAGAVAQNGTNFSGGQKQRLTIARAMIEDAPMLILDEATSSVDTRTELLIQRAMDELTKGRTSFVIAHRLSTIRNADLILVLKDGDVIESGTHESLLQQGGFYAELYNSQFEPAA